MELEPGNDPTKQETKIKNFNKKLSIEEYHSD